MKSEAEIRAAVTVLKRGLAVAVEKRNSTAGDLRSLEYKQADKIVQTLRLKLQTLLWVLGEGPNSNRVGP